LPPVIIKSNERVVVAGQTGSGKTYLSKYLTNDLRRAIFLDSKDELGDWNVVPFDDDAKEELLKGEDVRARVLPPVGQKEDKYWEEAFEFALTVGNITLFIDEAFAVFPNAVSWSPMQRAVWTRGRSLGVGAVVCTQRPSGIPLFIISEAQHQFCFYLQLEDDRKRMAQYMGPRVLETPPDEHGFYYHHTREETVYYSQLEVVGRRAVVPEPA
jgi:DNA helicase HerA-like ATPase